MLHYIFNPKTISEELKSLSHVRLFVTPWTVAYEAPLSMEFFRQEYWSGVPSPSPTPGNYAPSKRVPVGERLSNGGMSDTVTGESREEF